MVADPSGDGWCHSSVRSESKDLDWKSPALITVTVVFCIVITIAWAIVLQAPNTAVGYPMAGVFLAAASAGGVAVLIGVRFLLWLHQMTTPYWSFILVTVTGLAALFAVVDVGAFLWWNDFTVAIFWEAASRRPIVP